MQHFLLFFAPYRCKQLLFCLLASLLLFPLLIHAQPRLIKDIYPNQAIGEPIGSNLTNFINVKGIVYFIGEDGKSGQTLWKTDGTPQGTMKVAPGKIFGVSQLTDANGTLYFISSGGTANELWKTDGTADGTVKVAPSKAVNIGALANVNGTLFFTDSSVNLWKSDGTAKGTLKVTNELPGSPGQLQVVGNTLYFSLYNFQQNYTELWKSNGTAQSTVKVAGGFTNGIYNAASYNNMLFFVNYDQLTGRNDLWKSDGTEAGTVRLTPSKFAYVFSLKVVLGSLYFVAGDANTYTEDLWKTDGTEQGTVKVAPGKFTRPSNFELMDNKLYFTANDNTGAYTEIWKTDGTEEGTIKVAPGKAYFANSLTNINGVLYFTAYEPGGNGSGYELWKSDGTEQGTLLVKDIVPGWQSSNPRNFVYLNTGFIFSTFNSEGNQYELWFSNGTEQSSLPINKGLLSSCPAKLIHVDDKLFFTAYTPEYGEEIWKSDGTEAGTVFLKNITPGPGSTSFNQLINVNNRLYFTTGETGNNLWKSDGTEAGTSKVSPNSNFIAYSLTTVDSHLFFSANGYLWKTDGTEEGTIKLLETIQNPYNLTNVKNVLYYTASNPQNNTTELWKSDGTSEGTVLVTALTLPQDNKIVSNLISVGDNLFFTIGDFSSGYTFLYKSDGTAAGTDLIKDIYLDGFNLFKMNQVNVNGTLFFAAKRPNSYSYELWKSDGTEAGTISLTEGKAYNPENLTAINSTLFFKTYEPMYGIQLWKSDGTVAGTLNVAPGKVILAYSPLSFVELNNKLIFPASEPNYLTGEELWQTDGTPAGTILIKDIYAGKGSSYPGNLTNVNGKLFFVAENGIKGRELWSYDPAGCTPINNAGIIINNVSVCVGNEASLIINNSQAGVTYKAIFSGSSNFFGQALYPFGESVIGGGNISLTLPTANLAPSTYTIEIYASGCAEQKLPYSVTVTVNALPEAPITAPVTVYAGESATLTVTNAPIGSSFRWYTQASGGTAIPGATTATYVTPTVTASATYYVAVLSECGESERAAAIVTVIGSPCTASGTILREIWEEVPGINLAIVPFQKNPSLQSQLTLFEAPSNIGNNYGQRIRGYICPPQTGNYIFWIAGDDNCELWLSANDDPATKTRIAHITGLNSWTGVRIWDKYATQKSALVYLQAGQKYYIEALHKEGIGNDNLAVGWQLPSGTMERPIFGERLSPYVPYGKGTLLKETWVNVMGSHVNQIPLQTSATTIQEITSFEAPSNTANNYGQRIRGYVHPPVSGDYTFWISGDDNCELWLSTDEDPANKSRIAHVSGTSGWTYHKQWNKFASQKSEKVKLVAGRKYYVEVLHKESIGSDNVAVGWQFPDFSLERPVPGIRLSPFTMDGQERLAAEQAAQTNSFALELYPNPSQGKRILIQSKGLGHNEKVEVFLYNGIGNILSVHSFQADESGGLFEELLFRQQLPAGIYTLMLQSDSQTSTHKLVITR